MSTERSLAPTSRAGVVAVGGASDALRSVLAVVAFLALLLALPLSGSVLAFICAGDGGGQEEGPSPKRVGPVVAANHEPVSGAYGALVVFARFADDPPHAVPSWAGDLFRPDMPGSVTHYYEDQSFGRLHLSGTVLQQVYAASGPRATYLASEPGAWGGVGRFVRDVLTEVDRGVDFRRFDGDGDGVVDQVVVLMVGEAIPGFIRGKATGFGLLGGGSSWQTADGVWVAPSRGVVAVVRSYPHAVGSLVHELGHWLGLPDLYDLSAQGGVDVPGDSSGQVSAGPAEDSAGVGLWGIMGWGALGWDGTGASTPTPLGAWEREQMGWAGPPGVEAILPVLAPRMGVRLAPVASGGGIAKIWLSPEEYYLLEVRDPAAGLYERGCPARGVLIWHVDLAGKQEDERRKLVDVECADGRYLDAGYRLGRIQDSESGGDNLDFWSHDDAYRVAHAGNRGDATDLYDGVLFEAFTPNSNPSTRRDTGEPSGLSVAKIRLDEKGASFDVAWQQEGIAAAEVADVRFRNASGGEFLEPGSAGQVSVRLMNSGTTLAGPVEVRLEYDRPDVASPDTTVRTFLRWPGDTTTVTVPLRVASPLVARTAARLTLSIRPERGAAQTRQVPVPLPELRIIGTAVLDGGERGGGWGNGDGILNPGELVTIDLTVRSAVGRWLTGYYSYAARIRFPGFLGYTTQASMWWQGSWQRADSTAVVRAQLLLPSELAGQPSLFGTLEIVTGAGVVGWSDTLSLAVVGHDTTPPQVLGVRVEDDQERLRIVVPDSLFSDGGQVVTMVARLTQFPTLSEVAVIPLEREGAGFAGVWDVSSAAREATLGITIEATDDAGNSGFTGLLQRIVLGSREYAINSSVTRLGKGRVSQVAYSPDGTLFAVAGSAGVRLYDAASLAELELLRGQRGGVIALSFSPDGATIASAGGDGSVWLWDVASRRQVALPEAPEGSVYVFSLAFSPDGTRLATAAGWHDTVRLWDVAQHTEVAVLRVPADAVLSVAFSPDGQYLASLERSWSSASNTVRLWDATQLREIAKVPFQDQSAQSIAFSPDGSVLAVGGESVHLFDAQQMKEVAVLRGYTSHWVIAFSPDGQVIAAGGMPGTVRLFDVARRKEVGLLQGHAYLGGLTSIAFSPDGQQLASAGGGSDKDSSVRIWDFAQSKEVGALEGYNSGVYTMAYGPDGKVLVVATSGGKVRSWDVATQSEIGVQKLQTSRLDGSMAFSSDGALLAMGDNGQIRVWDIIRHQEASVIKAPAVGLTRVTALAFTPDGKTLASGHGGSRNSVYLWDVAQNVELAALQGHTGGVSTLAFGPGGNLLASGSSDGSVRLWDVAARGQAAALPGGHPGGVDRVVFSPDGKLLASAGDNVVRLWDVVTNREVALLKGYASETGVIPFSGAIAFLPGQPVMAVGAKDGAIYLWDPARQQEMGILGGSGEESSMIVFSPDGKTLASVNPDGTISLHAILPTAVEADDRVAGYISPRPLTYALSQNTPNPFNGATAISYELPSVSRVCLSVYNPAGQRIRTLISSSTQPGGYTVKWDGRDSKGQAVSSGVYFYRLEAGEAFVRTRRMLLLR